jgi:succinate dehydrogenase flavin-adding protein (antitoxin of CptAB toxin-antitoxin module)
MNVETWELMSYVVTVVGLPLAIVVFALEQRKERLNEQDAVFESISEKYQEFLHVVLDHPDLHLFSMTKTPELTDEQNERMMIIFSMLIALFERAYVLMYEDGLKGDRLRRWRSWEDYMHEWCAREDFRDSFETLLVGEDPEFVDYIRKLAAEHGAKHVDARYR